MKIDVQKQIEVFRDFFDANYKREIHRIIQEGKDALIINFADLAQFDFELSEQLIEEPEETIKSAEISLEQFDLIKKKKIRARFINLPKSQEIEIRNFRSVNLSKLIIITGIVRQASDVRPQVTNARFECPACGNIISILQIEQTFREPSRCSCGRRGRFKLISKDLVDAQRLIIEEAPECLEGGDQPKRISVFLKGDLVEPKMEKKTTPGSKVKIVGVVKEVPIQLKTGSQSTRYELMVDANSIESMQETFEEVIINEEDEKQILEMAEDPKIYEKLVSTIAPSIYGHEDVKSALVLQLLGGVRKERPDGTKTRGDVHILLVGDPGCIAGDSQIALYNKGMEKIQNLGKKHLQPIKALVTKIRKNEKDRAYDIATLFHYYKKKPVLKLTTESGKELICTYNHPLLTKEGWKRVDEILPGTKIRVMPKIPNPIKNPVSNNFIKVKKKTGKLKYVSLPTKLTPELASLYGYIIGDGSIHPRGYTISVYINEEELDIIPILSKFWEKTFKIKPILSIKNNNNKIKLIKDKNGKLRSFISKQSMHILEVNSRQIAQSLSFLANKRVPQEIFKSPNTIIAKFISWLFEADGCAFGKGRSRTAIQLKSNTKGLLQDVQLLLLYFGIHSRIIENNLCIRRSFDMKLFAKYIGFNSNKKKEALKRVLKDIKNKSNIQQRKPFQRYEKVVSIIPNGSMDVYDFEVPISHSFIANGIVCHNSGKSEMLKFISSAAPKARYISGKGASAAGLTASVVKDEFLKGWALEAGALVLANGGIACLHPDTKVLIGNNYTKISNLFNEKDCSKFITKSKEIVEICPLNKEVCSFDEKNNISILTNSSLIRRKKYNQNLLKLNFRSGFSLKLTPDHKIINGDTLQWESAESFSKGDLVVAPLKIPFSNKNANYILDIIPEDWKVFLSKEEKTQLKSIILTKFNSLHSFNKNFGFSRQIFSGGNQLSVKQFKELISFLGVYDSWREKNLAYGRISKGQRLKINKINPYISYLLGFILGDGCVNISKRRSHIQIVQSSKKKEQINKILDYLNKIYSGNINPFEVVSSSCIRGKTVNSKAIRINLDSNLLAEIYNYFCNNKLTKVFDLSEECLKAFIAGALDSDGCISTKVSEKKNKNYYAQHINFFISNENEINKAFMLLLRKFDCYSTLKDQINIKNIEITGRNDCISLLSNVEPYSLKASKFYPLQRKTQISSLSEKIPKNVVAELVTGISQRINKSVLVSTGVWSTIYNYKYKKIQPSRLQLLRIKDKLLNLLDFSEILKINILTRKDSFLDEIISIESEPYEGYVYDLVIPEFHNFLAEGIIVHNCLDELDKISPEDTSAMHESMEQQTITISKANIQATLRSQTTILAAANPKLGRFDPYQPIAAQIAMPSTLINRFDLIFPIRDLPTREKDDKIASHILQIQKVPDSLKYEIPLSFFRKYIAYAKQKIQPKLSDAALKEIKEFYVNLRNMETSGEPGMKPIPITARQLEALVRLAEGSARVRLSPQVTKLDAKRAINILKHCLMAVGFDYETQTFDIDRISTGIPASQRSRIVVVREVIDQFIAKGIKSIPVEEILSECLEKGITRDQVDEVLDKLRRDGYVFEPRRGFLSRI